MKFFVKSIFSVLAVFALLTALLSMLAPIPPYIFKQLFAGILLALVFVSTGFVAFLIASKLKQKGFTLIIIASAFGRIVLLLAALFLLIRFSRFDIKTITISMLCSYFVFQIIEIIGFTKINPEKS